MFFCPHLRKARRHPDFDPEYWAEFPCGCYVCFPQYVAIAAVVTPLVLIARTYQWLIHRNERKPGDDDE